MKGSGNVFPDREIRAGFGVRPGDGSAAAAAAVRHVFAGKEGGREGSLSIKGGGFYPISQGVLDLGGMGRQTRSFDT